MLWRASRPLLRLTFTSYGSLAFLGERTGSLFTATSFAFVCGGHVTHYFPIAFRVQGISRISSDSSDCRMRQAYTPINPVLTLYTAVKLAAFLAALLEAFDLEACVVCLLLGIYTI